MNRFGRDNFTTRLPSIMDNHNAYFALQTDRTDETYQRSDTHGYFKKNGLGWEPLIRIPWHFFSLQNTNLTSAFM